MLIGLIILIICICILLLLVNKQHNNKHVFHKTTKKYIKNILPQDILISTRPIIKEKLVWVPPPIKYHHIKKDKGKIKEKDNIRDHKIIDNIKNNEFIKRIKDLDNKYTGNNIVNNNIIIDKDFNKNFENKVKHNFGKQYGMNSDNNNELKLDNNLSNKPGFNSGNKQGFNSGNKPGFNSGNKPGFNSGNKPGFNSGNKPGFNSGNKPGFNSSSHNSIYKSSHKEHFNKNNKPSIKQTTHLKSNKKIEHFDSYGYGSMIQHPKKNCPKLNMTQCLKFQNCGYITTYDFNNRCVPGDPHGPLDKKIKYQKYYHNDPFTRALIANDNHYRDMSEDVFDIE